MAKQSKRLINAEDLYKISVLESPRWNQAGDEVVFVQLKPDRAKNGYKRTFPGLDQAPLSTDLPLKHTISPQESAYV